MNTDETMNKLERKRAFARARAKKFYEENKDKVLGKQKEARQRFNQDVRTAYIERGIPFTRQPPQPVQRPRNPSPPREPEPEPEQEPDPQRKRFILNKTTKKITQIIDIDFVINNVGSLKKSDGEFISPMSQKNYINTTRDFFRVLNVDRFNDVLKNPKKVIDTLESAKTKNGDLYATNSKRHFSQMICKFLDAGWLGTEFKDKYKAPFHQYNERLDFTSRQASNERKKYHDIDKYCNKIKEIFGEDSREFIIAMLYKESTRRDDFKLKIVSNLKETDKKIDAEENYIVVPRTRAVCETVINAHKTAGHFDPLTKKLSPHLSDLIRQYMKNNNLNYGQYLFPTKSLSRIVSAMSKKAGYDDVTITKLRHMAITKFYHTNPTLEEKQKLAHEFGHSLRQQEQYAGDLIVD
jgi:hypothetical protein